MTKEKVYSFTTKYAADLIMAALLLGLLPLLVWKSRYGYGGGDESFYLTLAKRFALGDAPLCEEWNLAQLSGLLLMPLYKLHGLMFGGAEGIILHFRYIYIFFHLLTTVGIYACLRKHRFAAVAGCLVFYIYTPYDLMALSYNTMGIGLFLLCLCLYYRGLAPVRRRGILFLLSGVCFGGSVLCNPFLMLAYFLYLVFSLMYGFVKDRESFKRLAFVTLGAALVALYLAWMVLSRASLSDVLANLSHILNDPEHGAGSLYTIVYTYLYSIVTTYKYLLILCGVFLLLILLMRGRKTEGILYFGLTCLVCVMTMLMLLDDVQTNYNLILFPVVLCGFMAFVLTRRMGLLQDTELRGENLENRRAFLIFYGYGLVFTFCASMSSNQGINVICQGMPILLVGAALLIGAFVKRIALENPFAKGLLGFFVVVTLAAQLGSLLYVKMQHAFWETSMNDLTEVIEEGPLKGLKTSDEHAAAYEELLAEMKIVQEKDKESPVLVVTTSPWTYLYLDRPIGAQSSWISSTYSEKSPEEVLLSRLKEYYSLHPDRIPGDIYIARGDAWHFAGDEVTNLFCFEESGKEIFYEMEETKQGYLLHR